MEISKLDDTHWIITHNNKILSQAFTLKELEMLAKLATHTVLDFIAGDKHLNDYK